jgi:hypothetical protein
MTFGEIFRWLGKVPIGGSLSTWDDVCGRDTRDKLDPLKQKRCKEFNKVCERYSTEDVFRASDV